jgi:hypothetical protein
MIRGIVQLALVHNSPNVLLLTLSTLLQQMLNQPLLNSSKLLFPHWTEALLSHDN